MIKVLPTEIEIYDEIELLATLKLQDECCASIEIKTYVTAESWKDLSKQITKALKMFKLEGDTK